MSISKVITGLIVAVSITACGGGGGGGSSAGATSQLCPELRGNEAIYWDFINGVIRGDLPSTAFTIPFGFGGTYSNSTSLLLGYTFPPGWTPTDAVDVSGFAVPFTVAGSDLIRDDNQAVWRYLFNAQVAGGFTSAGILDAEVAAALNFLGNPAVTSEQCQLNVQRTGILGLESAAGRVVRAGDYTIMARTGVIIVSGVASYYTGSVTVARTTELSGLINDIFVPMITQLYGGGTSPAACEDDRDNDGDGLVDLQDPQCLFPDDDSEAT